MKIVRSLIALFSLLGGAVLAAPISQPPDCGVSHLDLAEGLHSRQFANTGWTLGQKKVLYMRVRFLDETDPQPAEAEVEQDMADANAGFTRMSFGQYSLSWVITPVIDLANTADFYIDRRDELLQEAYAGAALHGFDYQEFDLDLVRHSGIPSWAGGYGYLGRRGAWIAASGAYIIIHEIGHNLGLNHANFWDTAAASSSPKISPPFPTGTDEGREGHPFDPDSLLGHETIIGLGESREYGDIMDVMGSGDTPPQFNALFKSDLNWLKPGQVTRLTESGIYRLHAFDQSTTQPGNKYLLGLERPGFVRGELNTYWLQYKGGPSIFPGIPEGVQVHIRAGQAIGEATLLLDMTPGTENRQTDASLPIGKTFSDKVAGIHFTPLQRHETADYCDVAVYLGEFASNKNPVLQLQSSNLQVQPGEPIQITATATDPDGHDLAYFWKLPHDQLSPNTNRLSLSWKEPGDYVVRCEVSDLRGGLAAAHVVIRVGEVRSFRLFGKITDQDGNPVVGARVQNGRLFRNPGDNTYLYDFTDSKGEYILANLDSGSYTNGAFLHGYRIERPTTNAVEIIDGDVEFNFTASEIPRITVRTSSDIIEEGQEGTHFIFTRSGSTNAPFSIGFSLFGTAVARADFVDYFLKRISFQPGERTVTLPLNTFVDQQPEGEETVSMLVSYPTEVTRTVIQDGRETQVTFYYPGWELKPGPGTNFWTQTHPEFIPGPAATFTIKDAPGTPQQLLSVKDGGITAIEDPLVEGSFTISRLGDLDQAVLVKFDLSGLAVAGTDFQGLPKSLIIPAGETSLHVPIVPIQDGQVEGDESVTFALLASDDYQIEEGRGTASLNIRDNAFADLTLSLEPTKAGEFKLILLGQPGRIHILEESNDLIRWSPFRTNRLFNNRLEVILPKNDTATFFRAFHTE